MKKETLEISVLDTRSLLVGTILYSSYDILFIQMNVGYGSSDWN